MSITYPTTIDNITNPTSTDTMASPSHSGQHSDINDAVEALETKVGVNSSADTDSLDYKLSNASSNNPGHKHTLADSATDVTATKDELNLLDGMTAIDTDLSSVAATDTTLPSAKAVKGYVDGLVYIWEDEWATSTDYTVNDAVRNSTATIKGAYICLIAHTSGTFATDLAAGKWGLFVQDGDITTTTAKCRAYLNSTQANLTGNEDILINLDAETYDPGSNFDTTSHLFTAPITGYYQVSASVGCSTLADAKVYQIFTKVNGADYSFSMVHSGSTGAMRINLADIVYMVSGQTLGLYFRTTDTAGAVDLIATSTSTRLAIHLLST